MQTSSQNGTQCPTFPSNQNAYSEHSDSDNSSSSSGSSSSLPSSCCSPLDKPTEDVTVCIPHSNSERVSDNTQIMSPVGKNITPNISLREITKERAINYRISPIHSAESDADLSDTDSTFRCTGAKRSLELTTISHSSASSDSISVQSSDVTEKKTSRKRMCDPSKWKQNVANALRNTGQSYISLSKSKKQVPCRTMKSPCSCRMHCWDKINEEQRLTLFNSYWKLGNIQLQRAFIRSCMTDVSPKYRYTNAANPRLLNQAFYFTVDGVKIRVCKSFFIRTLDISDRQIRTVKSKTNGSGFVERDLRGRHENRKKIDPNVLQDIKNHINSIPRIESHYLRASTSREYIGGEKSIRDLWRDFTKSQEEHNKPTVEYWLYYKTFN